MKFKVEVNLNVQITVNLRWRQRFWYLCGSLFYTTSTTHPSFTPVVFAAYHTRYQLNLLMQDQSKTLHYYI